MYCTSLYVTVQEQMLLCTWLRSTTAISIVSPHSRGKVNYRFQSQRQGMILTDRIIWWAAGLVSRHDHIIINIVSVPWQNWRDQDVSCRMVRVSIVMSKSGKPSNVWTQLTHLLRVLRDLHLVSPATVHLHILVAYCIFRSPYIMLCDLWQLIFDSYPRFGIKFCSPYRAQIKVSWKHPLHIPREPFAR